MLKVRTRVVNVVALVAVLVAVATVTPNVVLVGWLRIRISLPPQKCPMRGAGA